MAGSPKMHMLKMEIGRLRADMRERFGFPAAARCARLSASQVPQRLRFQRTPEGGGVLFIGPDLVDRLGWTDGGLVYLTEVARTDVRASGPALIVEVV